MKTWIFIALWGVTGCTSGLLHSDNKEIIGDDGWAKEDIISFPVELEEEPGDLKIKVVHDIDFEYENLYLKITLQSSTGTKSFIKSIDLQFPDGTWKGRCRGGKCRTGAIDVKIDKEFLSGLDTVILQQWSRERNLPGIVEVGVEIYSTKGS